MDLEQIKILLERYNQGNCSPEEAAIVDQLFENIDRRQAAQLPEKQVDSELAGIKLAINQQLPPVQPKVRTLKKAYWWYAAAAAVLITAISITWINQSPGPASQAASLQASCAPEKAKPHSETKNGFVTLTMPKGYSEQLALEDGSVVTLNAGSKLTYPEHFGAGERKIVLEEGEAFFEVAPDQSRRFIVQAAGIATTALGTSFNVRAYTRENKVVVSLVSGKVKVDQLDNQASFILKPSEQVSYDRLSLHFVKLGVDNLNDIGAWKQGYLLFKDAPYTEVVTGIENRFNVTVVNQSDKNEWNYNGSFKKNETIKDVMDVICLTKSLSYTIKNDTVYLQNKN